ncbi:MAG: aryl-sulfate sulfotransferase [Solirubrobacterales bacterium]
MKRIGSLVAGFAVLVLLASAAQAQGARPSFTAVDGAAIEPAFSWHAHDYVTTCPGDSLTLQVDGRRGWRTKLAGAKPAPGDLTSSFPVAAGQGVDVIFKRKRHGKRHPGHRWVRAGFHVRCLPDDFPATDFDRIRPGGAKLFMVQLPDDYAAIYDGDGVPVWWAKADGVTDDAKVLPDGTISWNSVLPGASQTGAFDILSPAGEPIRSVGDAETDVHDIQLLPNGNYVTAQQVFRGDVDATAYGGAASSVVVDFEIRELTPGGRVVRSWKTADHIGLGETGRWWPHVVEGLFYDTSHWNAVEIDGRYMYLSFRHLDAIYKVDRRTGEIVWKLGGTETPESLEVLNDPRGDYPFGGQHDVRVQPNGTVTVFNNRTDLADAVPRAERFRIDEQAGTAKLVQSITDPEMTEARCCGSARRLPDRSWLISWGSNAMIGAYDDRGRPLYRMTIPDDAFTYRANPVLDLGARELRRAMDDMNR